jgi:Uma2 family endonuclease
MACCSGVTPGTFRYLDRPRLEYNHFAMSISPPPSPRYHVAQLPVRRFTVEEYHRLIENHFFVADEQFELIDGYITEKMSRNPPHDAAVNRVRRRIERALPPGWIVRIQSAITTADSEPEPDIAVARGDDDDYLAHHPGPDLALVVEVSNTTLATDRGPKLAAYARAGVAAFWIVNLDEAQLEVFTAPSAQTSTYAVAEIFKAGNSITISLDAQSSRSIAVGELFP